MSARGLNLCDRSSLKMEDCHCAGAPGRMMRHTIMPALVMLGLLGAASIGDAQAGAPLAKFQPPGFFRIMVGDVEVTALYDGVASIDAVKVLDEPAQDTETALKSSFLRNPLATSDNAFLINTGAKLILIDAGGGSFFGSSLGKLQANLRAAGYGPEQVDDILLTHLHRDHIGGLAADGQAAFPNAVIHADEREADYWLSAHHLEDAPADQKSRFQGAMTALAPYIVSGHFQTFTADSAVVPMVHAVRAYGHSVGHTMYVVESKGQSLWLVGDLINVGAVQIERPKISSSFDADKAAAVATREHVLDEAARREVLVGAAHLPFPGLGHISDTGAAWRWIPVDYSPASAASASTWTAR
jgi:glyoxylase-like metal-dependent hydrolase (beta-lactamase superfamily II)